ncbi:fasciclin domain-containing protein [Changchengzhania lutea]|uniref:fasciclin domain-containing protein n=1 Tax=Changchengzhania lutea TaxID=2049305 RepID=UPI00115D78CD|nr:fasciclin domain-containing protein [Changchengzhania lutea]
MKKLKNYTKIALVLFGLTATVSCSSDDDGPEPFIPTNNIVEIAQTTPQLSNLVTALTKYPDLVNLLSTDGSFTVFAPNNDAFTALLVALGQDSIDDIPESVLKNVLQYHVYATAALQASAVTSGTLTMANGENAEVVANSSGVTIANATVIAVDGVATNGVVHIIDSVMIPPSILPIVGTIVAPAYFNIDFTTLIAAVEAADPSILELLLSNGPSGNGLTLFAPTNAAFEAAGITDVNGADAILAYHVIDGTITASMLPTTNGAAAEVEAIGGNLYVTNAGGAVMLNGKTTVIATDIAGSNGVVHVIDRTLVPPTSTINEIVASFATSSTPEFTLLAAALAKAGLGDFFSQDGPYTVFAPTDAAFIAAGFPDAAAINAASEVAVAGILTHHVVKANAYVFSSDLSDGAVTMLNDQDVTINLGSLTIQDASGSNPAAGLIPSLLNVHATNGVVHVIDKVLLPQ